MLTITTIYLFLCVLFYIKSKWVKNFLYALRSQKNSPVLEIIYIFKPFQTANVATVDCLSENKWQKMLK